MSRAQRRALFSLVGTIGVAGSLVMGQLIVSTYEWRLDLTTQQDYVLSDHARGILAALERDVLITAFLRPDDPRNRQIEDLLERASRASDHVAYQLIDVNRNPAVARQYGVDAYGSVVVESGNRRRSFPNPDEQTLTAAIIQVTRPGRRRVYFLTGHGERSIRDRHREQGYSRAPVALIHELYEVGELRLDSETSVPRDAAALIIAAPREDVPRGVLEQIDAYVRQGGGLLVMLERGTAPNLKALLRQYGVVASDDVVLDRDNRIFAGDFLTMLVPGRSPSHPVSAGLHAVPLMSTVYAVTTEESRLAESATNVLKTAPESWQTTDPSVFRSGVGQYVAGRDTRGPVPVGASVRIRGNGDQPGRVLVYGDSDFASNLFLDYLGNRDLFLNSVNWLAREETLVASRPPAKVPGVNQFFLSARQGQVAFWLGTVIQPTLVLLVGIVVVSLHRRPKTAPRS